jgi:hypothetical protein
VYIYCIITIVYSTYWTQHVIYLMPGPGSSHKFTGQKIHYSVEPNNIYHKIKSHWNGEQVSKVIIWIDFLYFPNQISAFSSPIPSSQFLSLSYKTHFVYRSLFFKKRYIKNKYDCRGILFYFMFFKYFKEVYFIAWINKTWHFFVQKHYFNFQSGSTHRKQCEMSSSNKIYL